MTKRKQIIVRVPPQMDKWLKDYSSHLTKVTEEYWSKERLMRDIIQEKINSLQK